MSSEKTERTQLGASYLLRIGDVAPKALWQDSEAG